MEQYYSSFNLIKCLIKKPTCLKNVDNLSCINLIVTNHLNCIQNSGVYETSTSDFQKLIFSALETFFKGSNHELSNT